MAMKIRYNVHTTNKYSVFDSDNSEEEPENKNVKEINRSETIIEDKNVVNNNVPKKSNGIKKISPVKEFIEKKPVVTTHNNDRYKYPIPSLNDIINEKAYRAYKENMFGRGGNLRSKISRSRGNVYNSGTNTMNTNHFHRGSRHFDYKVNERRSYNSAYSYNKFDYGEKIPNECNNNTHKYEGYKRDNFLDYKAKSYHDGRKPRKQESVTIDFELYQKQQEKKMNSMKNADVNEKKKKKEKDQDATNEKNSKGNSNTKRNDVEEVKTEHPKRKAINVYQYILEEGGRVDRIPGFRRSFRNFRKGDANNRQYKNDEPKVVIDESILKNRDPPNIDDTRAFPSLTSK